MVKLSKAEIVQNRTLQEADYIIQTHRTLREIATRFGVNKSTVHKDLSRRLKEFNHDLYVKVRAILNYHAKIAPLRGGQATALKRRAEKTRIFAYCGCCHKEYDITHWPLENGVKCTQPGCDGYVISPSGKILTRIVEDEK